MSKFKFIDEKEIEEEIVIKYTIDNNQDFLIIKLNGVIIANINKETLGMTIYHSPDDISKCLMCDNTIATTVKLSDKDLSEIKLESKLKR